MLELELWRDAADLSKRNHVYTEDEPWSLALTFMSQCACVNSLLLLKEKTTYLHSAGA